MLILCLLLKLIFFFFQTFYNAALKVLTDTLPKSFNMSTDVNDQIQELFDKEKAWRKKYFYLLNNLNDLKAVVNKHTVDLQHNKNACPDIPKRSVGVQVNVIPIHNFPLN